MTGDIFTKNGVIHVIDDVLFNDECEFFSINVWTFCLLLAESMV